MALPGGDKRERLLLVDDDPNLCRVLARALEARGYDVITATNAVDAAALAGQHPPDFAVVDLNLPDRPGLQLVTTLRRLNPSARIVVLTGYGSIASAIAAIKLGATYYLAKPVNADDVVDAFARTDGDPDAPVQKPMSADRLVWEHINRVLMENNGNLSATARALSMHRRTLQRKLAKRPVRD